MFQTAAHGRSRHVADVSTVVKVVFETDVKEIVALVDLGWRILVLLPSEAVAMSRSLCASSVGSKVHVQEIKPSVDMVGIPGIPLVHEANVRVVGGVGIDAFGIVGFCAIAVVVGLAILDEAAHDSV